MLQLLESIKKPDLFRLFSLCGALSAILGSCIAAIPYRGKTAERYSPHID